MVVRDGGRCMILERLQSQPTDLAGVGEANDLVLNCGLCFGRFFCFCVPLLKMVGMVKRFPADGCLSRGNKTPFGVGLSWFFRTFVFCEVVWRSCDVAVLFLQSPFTGFNPWQHLIFATWACDAAAVLFARLFCNCVWSPCGVRQRCDDAFIRGAKFWFGLWQDAVLKT